MDLSKETGHDGKVKGYVVGLMFSDQLVALIKKNRPSWQAGLLNGVGGKIEPGEDPYHAMIREFREETGYLQDGWIPFAETRWDEGYVQYYACWNKDAKLVSVTDEQVDWYALDYLPNLPLVANLRWIIPLAQTIPNQPFYADIEYHRDPLEKLIHEARSATKKI